MEEAEQYTGQQHRRRRAPPTTCLRDATQSGQGLCFALPATVASSAGQLKPARPCCCVCFKLPPPSADELKSGEVGESDDSRE
nr:hypothetical protein Iba_chr06aCG0560 [Ipomoea batatas]GMD04975.1 hypothetical protein Iba_chr06bCG2210 [Ipomoea batatas]